MPHCATVSVRMHFFFQFDESSNGVISSKLWYSPFLYGHLQHTIRKKQEIRKKFIWLMDGDGNNL